MKQIEKAVVFECPYCWIMLLQFTKKKKSLWAKQRETSLKVISEVSHKLLLY